MIFLANSLRRVSTGEQLDPDDRVISSSSQPLLPRISRHFGLSGCLGVREGRC